MQPLKIREWNPAKQVAADEAVLFIGKRKTGKTTALIALLYELRNKKKDYPYVTVISGSKTAEQTFSPFTPDSVIHRGWQPDKVKAMSNAMELMNDKREKSGKKKQFCLTVLDDLGCDPKFKKAPPEFTEIMMNGRQIGMKPLVCLQDGLSLKPDMRNQFDWIVFARDIMPTTRNRIYEYYCEFLGKRFDKVFDELTENYGMMVINNTGNSKNIEDIVFAWWPKLRNPRDNPKQKPWKLGCEELWKRHREKYDPQYMEKKKKTATVEKQNPDGVKIIRKKR